jgi:hypothetical protein
MNVDTTTGEVVEEGGVELVPLDIAGLNEDELLTLYPTPVQCAGALLIARSRLHTAPKVLKALSAAVKARKREVLIARGYAYKEAAGRDAATRRLVAESDANVIEALERLDDAELALEYGRELRKALSEDIEILRSLNANFRTEHS